MKMKKHILALFSTITLATSLTAGPIAYNPMPAPSAVVPSSLYRDTEFFFDVYGSYLKQYGNENCGCDDTKRHGWGGGISIGEYFIPNIGLRADANFSNVDEARTQVCADLLLRYVIHGTAFAPYAFVGGGIESRSGSTDGLIRAGGGLEYRITPRFGLFTEASYAWIFSDERTEDLTVKAGVRFVF